MSNIIHFNSLRSSATQSQIVRRGFYKVIMTRIWQRKKEYRNWINDTYKKKNLTVYFSWLNYSQSQFYFNFRSNKTESIVIKTGGSNDESNRNTTLTRRIGVKRVGNFVRTYRGIPQQNSYFTPLRIFHKSSRGLCFMSCESTYSQLSLNIPECSL